MNKGIKGLIIAGSICTGVGLTITAVAVASNGFTFSGFFGEGVTNTTNIDDSFANIKISDDISRVVFIKSEDDKCKVEFYEEKGYEHTVSVENGTLTINADHSMRKWVFHFPPNGLYTKVYLPVTSYTNIEVTTNTGKIDIPSDFDFVTAKAQTDTGAIIWKAKVAEALTMDSNTGSISVENVNAKSLNIRRDTGSLTLKNVAAEDDIVVKSTTGRNTFTDCTAKNITVSASTGNNKFTNTIVTEQLKVKASTGDVTFDHSDAGSIDVETSTGGITGSLLTGKIFDAHSSTGKVSVPTGTTGGVAKLRTSTGRITITIVG